MFTLDETSGQFLNMVMALEIEAIPADLYITI